LVSYFVFFFYFFFCLSCFQFLGIPPKGVHRGIEPSVGLPILFPISRDPPEGGTYLVTNN